MRRLSAKWGWFAAFTACFAVLAAYVFWGTWSPDFAPVMPDDGVTHPLAFSDQFAGWFRTWRRSGTVVPLSLLFEPIVISKYWTQELKYVAALYFAALGLAYFLRGRGLSRLASYGAGLLLAFCGYWSTLFSAGHAGWFLLMSAIVPALAFMDRAIVGGRMRHWILLGATVGWGCFYQPDIFLLFAILLVAYGLYACCRERTFPWKGGLVALAFFALVGAPGVRTAFTEALVSRDKQIAESAGAVPAAQRRAQEKKNDGAADDARWIFVTNWSMPPEDTLEFFIPRIHGDTSCPMTLQLGRAAGRDVKPYTGRLGRPIHAQQGNYRQHSLYVGWVTCLLALLALCRCRTKRDILFFAIAAFVCWLFSMGRFCEPVYRVVYALPFGDYMRAPVKWHHVTEFCLCLMAGFGIETLFNALRSRGIRERTTVILVALVVIFGAIDLARVDRLFCAPIDLRMVRGRNAVTDEVLRRGKGTVCDLIEGANGLIAWSFRAHGVGMTRDISGRGVRFVLVGNDQVRRNPKIGTWLRDHAQPAGCYLLTQEGFRAAEPNASNVSLYQIKDVPPPPASNPAPSSNPLVLALGVLSLLGTLTALACLFRREPAR